MGNGTDEKAERGVRAVLEEWARATREGRQDDVLKNHLPDATIYDVLAPFKYEGTAAYRAGWDEWQPETAGEGVFDFEELHVTTGEPTAFAYGVIRCGGTLPDGRSFEDRVRATFCLRQENGRWQITHQHISMPRG
jgi:ketosteroid isomerase-like protein